MKHFRGAKIRFISKSARVMNKILTIEGFLAMKKEQESIQNPLLLPITYSPLPTFFLLPISYYLCSLFQEYNQQAMP